MYRAYIKLLWTGLSFKKLIKELWNGQKNSRMTKVEKKTLLKTVQEDD